MQLSQTVRLFAINPHQNTHSHFKTGPLISIHSDPKIAFGKESKDSTQLNKKKMINNNMMIEYATINLKTIVCEKKRDVYLYDSMGTILLFII